MAVANGTQAMTVELRGKAAPRSFRPWPRASVHRAVATPALVLVTLISCIVGLCWMPAPTFVRSPGVILGASLRFVAATAATDGPRRGRRVAYIRARRAPVARGAVEAEVEVQPDFAQEDNRPKPFSKDRLRAETDDPFAKVRIFFYIFGMLGSGVGLLFIVPRLLGSALGAPKAAPLSTLLPDLGITGGAALLFAFLTYTELQQSEKMERAKTEGALIGRLPVQIQGGDGGAATTALLSDLRQRRMLRSRRPVLCIGNLAYCRRCIESSLPLAQSLDRSDFLLVPIMVDDDGEAQVEPEELQDLALSSKGLAHIALPEVNDSWSEFCDMQRTQAQSQGMDADSGLVVIVKKNGRVGTRFLGEPNWKGIAGEVDARAASGLDTTNV